VRRTALLVAALWSVACTGAAERPDLLLITVDTLRADRLACYGGPPDVGTEICALADGGTRFAWAFSTASHTAPSMASMLTSQYPSQHGVRQAARSALRANALSVAELLHAAGYATAAFVSNPVLNPRRRFGQGFEVFDDRMTRKERNRKRMLEREASAATDAALAWASHAPRPWLIWVHYQDPHGPYDPPGGSPARDDSRDEVLPVRSGNSGLGGIPAYQALPGLHTLAAYEQRYLDEIRYLDVHVARLVEGLDALGPRPVVLLTADHGEAFGEDGFYFAHGHSVGLDQIRVPLLWRPRRPGPPRVVETPVSLLDVAPTLLRVAGLATPAPFEGQPLPLDGPAANPRSLFAEHRDRVAVVAGRTYWSRARSPDQEKPWYPARSAALSGDTALPAYSFPNGSGPEPAEAALEGFLERMSASAPGEETDVPEELHERLRALGYEE
jgi:arylsulfatase A-like enzyme